MIKPKHALINNMQHFLEEEMRQRNMCTISSNKRSRHFGEGFVMVFNLIECYHVCCWYLTFFRIFHYDSSEANQILNTKTANTINVLLEESSLNTPS